MVSWSVSVTKWSSAIFNRREFIGLVGAGAAFPAAAVKAQMERIADDHIQHYPIYYMRFASESDLPQYVFQLWLPGVVMGVSSHDWYRRIRLLTPQGEPWKEHDNVRDAIDGCPAHGLIADDGFSTPYHYHGYETIPHIPYTDQPLLLRYDNAEQFVAEGHLSRYQPLCTFEEFLKRNSLGEQE